VAEAPAEVVAATKISSASSAVLEQVDMFQRFEHVQGTDGFPSKPAPDVIFTLRSWRWVQHPKNCLFERNSPADIEAGGRARIETRAPAYGCATLFEGLRFEPDYWINDLAEWARVAANAS
jgi:phosphoglycolate phosphatase-like HAD superfamily hydrolase